MIPESIKEKIDNCPISPTNGRVCVIPMPFKPSKNIEIISYDNADITEGYVAALSKCKLGRRRTKKGWEQTNHEIEHDVKVGDRVIFKPQYVDADFIRMNGQEYRILDAWEIYCVVEQARPDGYESVLTGDKTEEKDRKLIFN